MSMPAIVRTVRVDALPRAVPRLGPWLVRAAVAAFCLGSALFLTQVRLASIRLQYELNDLVRQRQAAAARVAQLKVERESLSSPDRIEREARRLGLVYPDGDAIVVLRP